MEKLPNHCINGNIKPFAFVSGKPEEIQAEAQALLKNTQSRGGFVLSSGCEIPFESKVSNVEAMMKARFFHKLEVEKGHLKKANKEISRLNADLKAKIKDLKKAQKQIVQTEKLAMAGRLAAGIAHEINNPIGVIINRIECLRSESQEKPLSDGLMNDLNTINRYAHKISKIVADLSIFSRTAYTESEFTRIDLNGVLDDALFLIEQKIKGKKIKIIKKIYPGNLFIQGDAGRLEQVFINIINNSIQAISGSGSITVSTLAENMCVQTIISDSGTGISKEHFDKLYDPFFTTKEVGKGTGLGLTISHAIVKDHNGYISSDSQIDKGATFTVTFPKASELNHISL